MRRTGRQAALALTLGALLTGLTACGNPFADPHPVFGKPLGAQLDAAARTTQEALTGRFTSRLVYGSGAAEATDSTTGLVDWDQDTGYGDRAVHIPAAVSAADADTLDGGTGLRDSRRTYALRGGGGVYVRVDGDGQQSWLRFSAAERKKFGLTGDNDLNRLNGAVLPYGGTLAEVLTSAKPKGQPEKVRGGGRRYTVTVPAAHAADVLPAALASPVRRAEKLGHGKGFEASVELDGQGRLIRMSADLAPLLDLVHAAGLLGDVPTLHADLRLSRLGKWQREQFPGAHAVLLSGETLVSAAKLKPGRCADTRLLGLGSRALVPVDCADPHNLWKFEGAPLSRTVRDPEAADYDEARYAKDSCSATIGEHPGVTRHGAAEPANLVADGKTRFQVVGGDKEFTGEPGPDRALPKGARLKVTGSYECLVTTKAP